MPKIKIDYSFSNIDLNINYEIEGILNRDSIIFKDNNTLLKINLIKKIIIRENDEYYLELNLENKTGIYKVNKIGSIKLEPKLIEYKNNDNKLYIKYLLNDQIFELKVKYEVVK